MIPDPKCAFPGKKYFAAVTLPYLNNFGWIESMSKLEMLHAGFMWHVKIKSVLFMAPDVNKKAELV